MTITLVSFDGHAINDGTNYVAIIPDDAPLLAGTRAQYIERSDNWSSYAGKRLSEVRFPIVVALRGGSLETLKSWFDTSARVPVKLIGSESGAQYSRLVTPEQVTAMGSGGIQVTLACADPVWRRETDSTDSWNINGTGTHAVNDVGGNRYTEPTISLAVSAGAGWAHKQFVLLRNPLEDYAWSGALDITNGGFNAAAEVSAGRMQADGDDWRFILNGVEIPRWLDQTTMNGSTKLWANVRFAPRVTLTLETAIAASGAVGEIAFRNTSANKIALTRLPYSGMVLIDSELFTYTSVNQEARKLGGVTRAARGSAMAAHSSGATVERIEHPDAWMIYGNSSASAPVQDDSWKPIFDLTASTNTSWVYNLFADSALLRSGRWLSSVEKSSGGLSRVYSGDSAGEADPSQVVGLEMNPWQKNGKWQGESAIIAGMIYAPGGIASITMSGQKRRGGASWPSLAGLQKSSNGSTWSTLWNETTPATANSWTAWSRGSTAVNARYARLVLSGSIAGAASEQAQIEVATATVALAGAGVPIVSLFPRVAQTWLDLTIENQTTGDSFGLVCPLSGSTALVVDCEAHTVKVGGENLYAAIRGVVGKQHWLRLLPGDNTLRVSGAGVGTITATITWRERRL